MGEDLSESDFRARHGGKESLVERGTCQMAPADAAPRDQEMGRG